MKYIGLDQVEREHVGSHAFKMEKTMHFGYEQRRLILDPSVEIQENFHPVTAAMDVVASEPPFLRKQDCPWILAYMDDIRTFYNQNVFAGNMNDYRKYLSLTDKVKRFAFENDVISTTRMIYTIDIIDSIVFHGTVKQHSYFISDDDRSWIFKDYTMSFWKLAEKHEQTVVRLDIECNKQFKSMMTKNAYQGAKVMITIPEGEELSTGGLADKAMILNSGASFECTIVRFFKSNLFWANRATFEFYPEMINDCRDRLTSEPIFAVEMDMAKDVQSSLGWGATIQAFIPLHWISHVYFDGEYRAVGEAPIPQKTEDKLPIPMTTRDFDFFRFNR